MLNDAYARYDGVKPGRYKFDCYIFYKDNSVPTNIPTNINATMEPAFNQAFHQTPLHCHFAIWRMQRPNPSSSVVEYTDWYAYKNDDAVSSIEEAATHFCDVVLVKPAPPRP